MNEVATTFISEAALWGRLLEPAESAMSPEAARYFLALSFPPTDLARMRALAEKARAGTLTTGEQSEMDTYEQVGHALSLLKSKARQALQQTRTAS